MNKIRKAVALKILEELRNGGEGFKKFIDKKANESKDKFFSNLNPIKESAYTQVFLAILQKHDDLKDSEDKAVAENWSYHFVDYHNEMVELLKVDYSEAVMKAHREFDREVVYTFFTDERSLEELIDTTANCFLEAIQTIEKEKELLKEKLTNQLSEVVATLKELTKENNTPNKQFEIETDGATFNIEFNGVDDSDNDCECESCELEKLIKSMLD